MDSEPNNPLFKFIKAMLILFILALILSGLVGIVLTLYHFHGG